MKGSNEPSGMRRRMAGGLPALLLACLLVLLLLSGCSGGNARSDSQADDGAASDTASKPERGTEAPEGGVSDGAKGGSASIEDRAPSESAEPAAGGEEEEYEGDDAAAQPRQPEPQAGMLTAGEWQDTIRWSAWQQLIGKREGRSNQRYWQFYRFDRLVVKATAAGEPVADAAVTVQNDGGDTVWEARTDVNGIAYAYAGLFSRSGGQANGGYYVEVRSGNRLKRFENVALPRKETLEVKLDGADPAPPAVDILFAVDTTGSMQDELDYLETELADVIDRVRESDGRQLSVRIGTDFYRDVQDDYTVRSFPFTDDVGLAVKRLSEQQAAGGADYPEAVDEALKEALRADR